jgi:hypothetical protein
MYAYIFDFSEVKMWEEAKVEFAERNNLNLQKEKEKEIQKSFLLEDEFWK